MAKSNDSNLSPMAENKSIWSLVSIGNVVSIYLLISLHSIYRRENLKLVPWLWRLQPLATQQDSASEISMTEMTHQEDVEEEGEVVGLDPLALYFNSKTFEILQLVSKIFEGNCFTQKYTLPQTLKRKLYPTLRIDVLSLLVSC